ncbi:uncharacterized protein [Centroberyx affinis]|uniref:uncharacterized protein isoform X1 n=1 Tax=Centroberyx affinis TaxID=166261 RepID=UPI003A5C6F75
MKDQMRLFFLLAAVTLLVQAQTPAEPNYEDFLLNLQLPLENFRPLLNQLQVETLQPTDEDLSAVPVRSLTFPAQETECDSTQEHGNLCHLKTNGKLILCNVKVTHPVQDVNDITASEVRCEMATEEAPLKRVRTRRSKAGRGSGRGNGGSRGGKGNSRGGSSSRGGKGSSRGGKGSSRGRSGGGSSIAGRGNRGNSGTRTA